MDDERAARAEYKVMAAAQTAATDAARDALIAVEQAARKVGAEINRIAGQG